MCILTTMYLQIHSLELALLCSWRKNVPLMFKLAFSTTMKTSLIINELLFTTYMYTPKGFLVYKT